MISEEFPLIGILDEEKARGQIKPDELKALLCEHIQVDPYYPILIENLSERGVAFEEKTKIDIDLIFQIFKSAQFIKAVPSFYKKRITKYTIRLLRAALIVYTRGFLTMKQIGDCASIHQMKEFEYLSTGIPCDAEVIRSMLWIVGRTISDNILEKWLELHGDYLENKNKLMVHEFMYLFCNTKDRKELYNKIPKLHMNPRMDKNLHIFQVDYEFHKTYMSPDTKMQHMLNLNYNVDKAIYEGVSKPKPKVDWKEKFKSTRRFFIKKEVNHEEEHVSDLRKQLRSLLATVEIKKRIKDANQKVFRMKLNGRIAYDELALTEPNLKPALGKNQVEGEEDTKKKQEKKKPALSTKKIEFSRPQTALLKITSPKSPQTNIENLRLAQLRPQTPLDNLVARPLTSKATDPGSMSNRLTTAPTTVSTRERKPILKPSSALKRDNNTPSAVSDRQETQVSFGFRTTDRERRLKTNTSNLTLDSRADIFSEYEDAFNQEYRAFEYATQFKSPQNRPSTALYYSQGTVRMKIPRILSSK